MTNNELKRLLDAQLQRLSTIELPDLPAAKIAFEQALATNLLAQAIVCNQSGSVVMQ